MQQTPGGSPGLRMCRKLRRRETRPPTLIIHQPPCWARSPSPRQRLGNTAAAPDGGRCRPAAVPACQPVGNRGGCGGAVGGWRRMAAGPGPLHSPMVRHRRKEAGRKRAGRLGGARSRDAVTSPRRQSEARAVAGRRGGAEGMRRTMAAAAGPALPAGLARSGHCQGSVCRRSVLPVRRVTVRTSAVRAQGPASRGGAERAQKPSRTRAASRDSLISICTLVF